MPYRLSPDQCHTVFAARGFMQIDLGRIPGAHVPSTTAGSFTVTLSSITKKAPFRAFCFAHVVSRSTISKIYGFQQTRPAFAFPLANRCKAMAEETPSDTTGASQMPVSPKNAVNSIPISAIPAKPRNKDKNCEYFGSSIAEK